MKVVIMAGGKGTRIAEINSDVPKPMIKILGKPILEYQIMSLKKQGFDDFILIIGHLGNIIKDYFKNGQEYGVSITYIEEGIPLGTAGALYYLKDELLDDFLLINGDIIFDIDVERFIQFHRCNKGLATLFTHPNNHPYDSGIIETDKQGCVNNWLHKEEKRVWYRNRVNAGIHLISPRLFEACEKRGLFREPRKIDLDREVLKPLIPSKELFVYDSPEYVKDMGTPERYYQVLEDISSGKVQGKCLKEKQKAIFLDRDGTINHYVGFLRNIDDFELIEDAAEAIKMINELGYLAIVVTNQPVIARGEITLEQLELIHKKMETLLGKSGAYLDAIYYCPHHPHSGYAGEVKELKVECSCRKPKPGMLLAASKDYNISLEDSWMIGDGEIDIQAGKAAGCQTILITKDKSEQYRQTRIAKSLYEAVQVIDRERRKCDEKN